MIAIVDAHYTDKRSAGALVLADRWTSEIAASSATEALESVADYEPGQFYKRELPVLLKVLEHAGTLALEAIVIDGYCTLDQGRPGLGAHLHQAIGRRCPIVGVAKTEYRGAIAEAVERGESKSPLYVTALGIDPKDAAAHVRSMHGPFRIPTLIKEADRLARETV
jgi:deoxyribonuclease V